MTVSIKKAMEIAFEMGSESLMKGHEAEGGKETKYRRNPLVTEGLIKHGSTDDTSDEALILEAVVDGYLVRRSMWLRRISVEVYVRTLLRDPSKEGTEEKRKMIVKGKKRKHPRREGWDVTRRILSTQLSRQMVTLDEEDTQDCKEQLKTF
ncbi:hypothetical protein Tco_0902616 [Tanacetum coccineum]